MEKINGQETSVYQEETERESSTLQTERKTEIINNLITNLILEKKLPEILKEIQEVIDRHLKVISKKEWNIGYTDLVEHEIYFKYDYSIKRSVRYVNFRLAD